MGSRRPELAAAQPHARADGSGGWLPRRPRQRARIPPPDSDVDRGDRLPSSGVRDPGRPAGSLGDPAGRHHRWRTGIVTGFAATQVLEPEEAGLDANEYRFINHWFVPGTLAEVSEILADPEAYHRWWPCAWLDYKGVSHGGKREVGGVFEYRVKGWLPYSLRL